MSDIFNDTFFRTQTSTLVPHARRGDGHGAESILMEIPGRFWMSELWNSSTERVIWRLHSTNINFGVIVYLSVFQSRLKITFICTWYSTAAMIQSSFLWTNTQEGRWELFVIWNHRDHILSLLGILYHVVSFTCKFRKLSQNSREIEVQS